MILPDYVQTYLATNYADYEIEEAKADSLCDGTQVFEVELEDSDDNEIELVFDNEENLLFTEVEINTSALPAAITNSIATNYANYTTEEADRLDMADGTTRFEVELKNGQSKIEVLFEADGTVICEEEDDDE